MSNEEDLAIARADLGRTVDKIRERAEKMVSRLTPREREMLAARMRHAGSIGFAFAPPVASFMSSREGREREAAWARKMAAGMTIPGGASGGAPKSR